MTPKQAAQRLPKALASEDWLTARKALTSLLKADPNNTALHYNLGLVFKRLERPEDALSSFDAALALDDSHANALFESAATLLDLERHGDAAARFDRYTALRPDDPDGWRNLGRISLHLNDTRKAARAYEEVMRLCPSDLDAEIGLAEARLRSGDDTDGDALRKLYAAHKGARPRLLKAMHQGPRGCVPLDARRLHG